ncbi:hypothetical protein JL721_4309 [Aureococcus anophagefferens]|nr:hypothetical protein JL721_4309 [Aureococcus anophagefferens]
MLRLGAGLESTIVGDLTIGRQLWDLREACLATGAIATNGPLCALVDAARAAGRRTRDERLGDLSIARFPSREDRMTDDEKRAVLDHARMVVADEHASLKASGRSARRRDLRLRRRSDERVRRAADAGADNRRARAANAVLHAPRSPSRRPAQRPPSPTPRSPPSTRRSRASSPATPCDDAHAPDGGRGAVTP